MGLFMVNGSKSVTGNPIEYSRTKVNTKRKKMLIFLYIYKWYKLMPSVKFNKSQSVT